MAATPKSAQRRAALDQLQETIDVELASAAERMASAERSLVRARDRYAGLIEARTNLRALDG